MINLCATLSYEGTHYLGWQKTKIGASIQEEIEKALGILFRHPITCQAASRTDRGVHAKGQVINFLIPQEKLELSRLQISLNALLPHDIQVLMVEEVPLDFHATLQSCGKEYGYQICTSSQQSPFLRLFSWHFPRALDIRAMRNAAKFLLGSHDFSSLCNDRALLDSDPRCTLYGIAIEDCGEERVQILVQGNRFLYKMMRNLAGTLAYVGCGKIAPDSLRAILTARDRRLAGMTAPAHGLYLERVFYAKKGMSRP